MHHLQCLLLFFVVSMGNMLFFFMYYLSINFYDVELLVCFWIIVSLYKQLQGIDYQNKHKR